MDTITIDTILDWFKQAVESKTPIGPGLYLESATKLVILKEDIDSQIASFEAEMALKEAEAIGEGKTAATAKILKIGAINYKEYLLLRAKEKRIQEFIRLAKKMSTLISENKNY
jgi:hypothetical protein